MKEDFKGKFEWQEGYGAFSYSESDWKSVIRYMDTHFVFVNITCNLAQASMKFLVLFSLAVFTGVAQTSGSSLPERINSLISKNIPWSRISGNDFTPAEKNTLGMLINDSSNAFCLDFRIDGDYLDDFHLLDLDGDKDLDLIFEGFECAGLSTKTVLIYLNKNKRYEKSVSVAGRIAELRTGIDLTIYKYPCCSMIDNTLISYAIAHDSLVESSGLHFFFSPILKPLSKDYELIVPKKIKAGRPYILKAGSSVYYVPIDSLEHPVFIQESLAGAAIHKAHVTAYSSTTDKEGIQWLYVEVPKDVITLKNNKAPDYPLMIWIKERDCINAEH